jgi:mRNA-degrading endonuclease RelE of RelBE toxin-antitoxin system
MTSIEIKTEIQKVLDQVPESVLQNVLDFLKELRTKSADNIKFANNLRRIISEDRELLEKLTQ